MKRVISLAVALLLATCWMATTQPRPAFAAKAADYGYDWYAEPYNSFDLFDAAARAAYYQELDGYTTMYRDRGTGENIYDKLNGTDAGYTVINVISHSNSDCICCRPEGTTDTMSCIYQATESKGEHSHGIYNEETKQVVSGTSVHRGRLQALTGTAVRWMMLQGCNSAGYYQSGSVNFTSVAHDEGVDVTSGFYDHVWFGGDGSNWQSYQYNFAARYWKSLHEGDTNNNALDDGAEQVNDTFGWYGGYNAHRRYGENLTF